MIRTDADTVGIVGGGIAGLAAAYRLQRRGHDVRIFEASDDIGGLAATYETAGDPIEQFYHHLSKSEHTIVELASELGLGTEIEWRIGKNAYYVDGEVHPLDTPFEILAYPHMSLYDKVRLAALTKEIDLRGGMPRFDTYEDIEDYEDVPVREFLLEHTTRGIYENFFEPLLDAKFGSRKEAVSAAWLLGRVKFRGERDLMRGEILGYFDGGFARLIDALIEAVGRENITTGASVTDIELSGGGVDRLVVEREGTTERHDVDSAVVAAMPNVLEELTGYECAIEFQGTVCSVLSLEESLMDTYWLNIADEAPFGALLEHTNFVPRSRYGGEHLLYAASYIQSPEEDLWRMDDEEVEETWLSGLESLFPDFDSTSVNWIRTARNPRSAPVYERGYLDMVVPYDLSTSVGEGVYYAGMASRAQYPERSLNGAIEAGYACADLIDEGTKTRQPIAGQTE
ncbi:tRNA 5-methylaminomethyl-2-thiouridine biosynthesis bifunctional protein MnmC [Halalkalicoccus paucihalophilus]|uniref:tRNA 5-methylaminomethyl-2-thiouridine biosynthesis bifunctional protein MnmC n=1 Tax=Halalkalicoccus paucihalophilus TaxID=1008153 RepID=A0A151AJM7_9EURY|nr:NAD(P)/FAD-dependent oxidoreductase [Halalkalicoccus paucihalophilus]KYH27824.1 tRNA 5-methylaminomethyl-2-thiouridine biosynthesis bifunctional protein MnmC [Halalkalicoccus paucihalophilus]